MTTASELMRKIGDKIRGREELKQSVGATYKFVLSGDGGGTFLVDLKQALTVTEADGAAACTVSMAASDFVDLFEGRQNGQALFFSGKLRVDGDMSLALKLGNVTDILK